ncbi:MAG TPA: branched-chain amino acid ABC transporter permease [Actinopolymorphaceae bacterium]|jgi:branched-chain amino acid transport system permease protein
MDLPLLLNFVATVIQASGGSIDFNTQLLAERFWANTIDGLAYGSIYALVAIGYTLVYGVLKLINFAHSEVFIVGAFGAYATFVMLGYQPGVTLETGLGPLIANLTLAGLVAMLCSAATAFLLERVAYRPLRRRNAPRLVFLITAIGASFAIQQFFLIWRGGNPEPSIRLLRPEAVFEFENARITQIQIIVFVAAIVLLLVADTFVNRTRLGRGLRAVAQDPDTAALMGVNQERVIMLTFALGGLLAGAAALFYIMQIPQGVLYNGGFILGIKAFTAAVLGGIGNLRGAVLGGLLLGVVENYGQTLFGGEWRDVVAFVVLIAVLMVRPTGILGESLGKARV